MLGSRDHKYNLLVKGREMGVSINNNIIIPIQRIVVVIMHTYNINKNNSSKVVVIIERSFSIIL